MPDPAEPTKEPRRQRHYFGWVMLGMVVLLFASTAALFKWGDMEKMPGFVQIWKARGDVLVSQIRFGRGGSGGSAFIIFRRSRLHT